ncbi:Hypothetical protein DHA2_153195 [Giardia duodenalis]|uniref:Uncharacterized protein n=1 Tax=Giardia intestinalis TaxID=5741 RepID=V6TBM9_GIAIN|nr:Hypothetical protein DHA2_153195 [Giardia intestinalis]
MQNQKTENSLESWPNVASSKFVGSVKHICGFQPFDILSVKKNNHREAHLEPFLTNYGLTFVDTQLLLTEDGLIQSTGLIPCNNTRWHSTSTETTCKYLKAVSRSPSQATLSHYSDLFLPNQFMPFLRALLYAVLNSYGNSSILQAEKMLLQLVQGAVSSRKISLATILAVIRFYPTNHDGFPSSQRFLLIAFLQQLLNTDLSAIQLSIKLAYASFLSEQSSLSMWQQQFGLKSPGHYNEHGLSIDMTLLSRNLIMEYSSTYTDTNLFYSQKLLDYIWCTSKSPSLGAFTLSTIGPSLYTYHKPMFNNSLAVFSVTLGGPNTVLCDPLQFSVYQQFYLSSPLSKVDNSVEDPIFSQLAILKEEEMNTTVYSYRDILSSLQIIPSEYLSPLIATGNMTSKTLQVLAHNGFYATTDNPLYTLDVPGLRLHCGKSGTTSVSSVLVGLGIIKGVSMISSSNLYAYSGRMFVAEHMDSFSLACCLPGMAYRLAIFHGFPEYQKKAIEKYALHRFYSEKPELFLFPTAWTDDYIEPSTTAYSLPQRASPTHSSTKKTTHTSAQVALEDVLLEAAYDVEEHMDNALEACSFSLSNTSNDSFNFDNPELCEDSNCILGNMDCLGDLCDNYDIHPTLCNGNKQHQETSFLGDTDYFCNASECQQSVLSESYDSDRYSCSLSSISVPLSRDLNLHNLQFLSAYRDSIDDLTKNPGFTEFYTKNMQRVAEAQKELYDDMLANELEEKSMYLTPPILKTQIYKTDTIPNVHLLTQCLTGRYSPAKRAAIFLVGPHGHTPCCFYGQRNRFLLVKNREKIYTREQSDSDNENFKQFIKQQQRQRAISHPLLSTPYAADPTITPTPINPLKNNDPKSSAIKKDTAQKVSNSSAPLDIQDTQQAPLFKTYWVLRELPTVALLGQMHPLPSFSMQLPTKKHIRRVQAVKFADYRSKIAAIRGDFDDSEAVRHVDKNLLKRALDVSESDERSTSSVSRNSVSEKGEEISQLDAEDQFELQDIDNSDSSVNTERVTASSRLQKKQTGKESATETSLSVGVYKKGAQYQCDTIPHVLSVWNIENFIRRRLLYMLDRLIDETPTDTCNRITFSELTSELSKKLFKVNFMKDVYKNIVFNSRYYAVNAKEANIKKLSLKSYSDPIEILMFENVLSTGGFVDNFLRKTSSETYLLQAVINDERPGSFLLDRFIGWSRLVISFYTDYRASYLQALRDMRFLLTYSHADVAGIRSFGSRQLKYGADTAGVEDLFREPCGSRDLLFKNRMHVFPYATNQKAGIASMLNNIYSVIASSLEGSTFYPMEKVYISPYSTIGLYARFIKLGESSFSEETAKLRVSDEKLKEYIDELSTLEPPMRLPNVVCHAKMAMLDKDQAPKKDTTIFQTLRVFGIAIHELLGFIDIISKTKNLLTLDRYMFSVLETGYPSEFLFRYRLFVIAKDHMKQNKKLSGKAKERLDNKQGLQNVQRSDQKESKRTKEIKRKNVDGAEPELKKVSKTKSKKANLSGTEEHNAESPQPKVKRERSKSTMQLQSEKEKKEMPSIGEVSIRKHRKVRRKKSHELHTEAQDTLASADLEKSDTEKEQEIKTRRRRRRRRHSHNNKNADLDVSTVNVAQDIADGADNETKELSVHPTASYIPITAHFPASLTDSTQLYGYLTTENDCEEITEQSRVKRPAGASLTPAKRDLAMDLLLYKEFFETAIDTLVQKYNYYLRTEEGSRVYAKIDPSEGQDDVTILDPVLRKKLAIHIHPFDVYTFCIEFQKNCAQNINPSKADPANSRLTLIKYVFHMIELLSRSCITQFLTVEQMYAMNAYQLNHIDRQYRERDLFLEVKMHKHIDFLEGRHNGIIDDDILKVLKEPSGRVLVASVFGDGQMRTIERHRIALGEIPCYLYTDSPFMSIQALGHSVIGGEIRRNYLNGLVRNKANGCKCIPDLNICRYSGSFNALTYEIDYLQKYLADPSGEKIGVTDNEDVFKTPQADLPLNDKYKELGGDFQRSLVMHTSASQDTPLLNSRVSAPSTSLPAYPYHVLYSITQEKKYYTNVELISRIERYKNIWTPAQNRAFLQLSLPMVQLTSTNRTGSILVFPHTSSKRIRSLAFLLSPATFLNGMGRSRDVLSKQRATKSNPGTDQDSTATKFQYIMSYPVENRTQVELIFDFWIRRRQILAYGNLVDGFFNRQHTQLTRESKTYPPTQLPELSPNHYSTSKDGIVVVHNISMTAAHYADYTRGNMNLALADALRESIQSHTHLFPLTSFFDKSSDKKASVRGRWIDILAAPSDSIQALQLKPLQSYFQVTVSKDLKYKRQLCVIELVTKMSQSINLQLDANRGPIGSIQRKFYDLDDQPIFHLLECSVTDIYKDFLELANAFYCESIEVTLTTTKFNTYIFKDPLLLEAVSSSTAQDPYRRYTAANPIYYTTELFKDATDAALTRDDIHHATSEIQRELLYVLQYTSSIEACAYDCLLNFLHNLLDEESRNPKNQRIAQAFSCAQSLDRGSRRGDLARFMRDINNPLFVCDIYSTVSQMELRGDLPTEAFFYMIRSLYKLVVDCLQFYIPENSMVYGQVVATENALLNACTSAREATYGVFLPLMDLIASTREFFNRFWRRFSIMTAGYLYTKVSTLHVYGNTLHKHQIYSIVFLTMWQLEHLYCPLYRTLLTGDVVVASYHQRHAKSSKG